MRFKKLLLTVLSFILSILMLFSTGPQALADDFYYPLDNYNEIKEYIEEHTDEADELQDYYDEIKNRLNNMLKDHIDQQENRNNNSNVNNDNQKIVSDPKNIINQPLQQKRGTFIDDKPSVEFCVETKILRGDGNNLNLDGELSRIEAAVLIIRLFGEEEAAMSLANKSCPFSDIPDWAIGYANYAYENGILKGYQGKLNPHDKCTPNDFATMLYRALSMVEEVEFRWKTAVRDLYANELIRENSVNDTALYNELLNNDKIKRRHAVALCYRSLSRRYTEYNNGKDFTFVTNETFADRLLKDKKISMDIVLKYDDIEHPETIDYIHKNNKKQRYYYYGESYYEVEIKGDELIFSVSKPILGEEIKILVEGCKANPGTGDINYRLYPDGDDVIWDGIIESNSGVIVNIGQRENVFFVAQVEIDYRKIGYGDRSLGTNIGKEYIVRKDGENFFFRNRTNGLLPKIEKAIELFNDTTAKEAIINAFKDGVDKSQIEQDIINKAEEVTRGISSDYDKAKAICTWIADNVYYDLDYYLHGGTSTNQKAIDVLNNKTTDCEGYANLAEAMLTAVDIPNYYVTGVAAGMKGWEDHAWNEAFLDGRWVVIDTTFTSVNKYENGQMIKGEYSRNLPLMSCFDQGINLFTESHITNLYSSHYVKGVSIAGNNRLLN